MSLSVILAAGIGSRMGHDCPHKALMPLKGKAILSYLIERSNSEKIIIAVGHKKQQIIDYVKCVHPYIDCTFVHVENFQGTGSGPGHSMECCRNLINEPFYLLTSDSYVEENLPPITEDWIGIFQTDALQHYSTCAVDENNIVNKFKNKSAEPLDFAFSGIMAVKNHEKFWQRFDEYKKERKDNEMEAIGVLYEPFYAPIRARKLKYNDTGTKKMYDDLYEQVGTFATYELKKDNIDEVTYKIHNKIIKLGDVSKIDAKKQKHALLKPWCTAMFDTSYESLLCYEYADGMTLYDIDDELVYIKFLQWLDAGLFKTKSIRPKNYRQSLEKFYKNKTLERVEKYLISKNLTMEHKFIINGRACASIAEILIKIDWHELCDSPIDSIIHGDLNFGNVIAETNNSFKLIDWRDSMDGHIIWGDRYYDLAKIYAGCCLNYKNLASAKMPFKIENNKIYLEDMSSTSCKQFLKHFEKYIVNMGIKLEKVKNLAFLSYLNMAPLHPALFGDFLAYYGIYMLSHD
jgi:GTP:adenosylcobinamide-phosphate guanylyltransferase